MEDSAAGAGGRRGNGLQSREWGALVDLDPRLSDGLLDRLAASGVAAYVEPAGGTVDSVSRAVWMPDRPLDRLWVDPTRADDARDVVAAEVADLTSLLAEDTPGATAHGLVQPVPRAAASRVLSPPPLPEPPKAPRSGVDQDDEFRRIVESMSQESQDPVPSWPVTEDVDEPRTARRDEPAAPSPAFPAPDDEDNGLPGWLEPDALPDEGHYEPPVPPPVPRPGRRALAAGLIVVLGLVLLFAPWLLGQAESTGVRIFGILVLAGGSAALVWQMRDAPPGDDTPDDGAVV